MDRRKARFLTAITKHLTIGESAKAIGVDRRTVLRWREADPNFDRQIYEAQDALYDQLEATGFQRALSSDEPPQQRFLYWVAMLKARRHDYRDNHKAEVVTGEIIVSHRMTKSAGYHQLPEHTDQADILEGEYVPADG